MIITVCYFAFASLVSTEAVSEECFTTTSAALPGIQARCDAVNKDPLSTCEVQRMGATRYYVRLRSINGSRDEAPSPPTAPVAGSSKASK